MKKIFITFIVVMSLFVVHQTAHAATFTVDSLLDTADNNIGDGICDDGNGNCTLRAAIAEAKFIPGGDDVITITVNGTLSLSSPLPTLNEAGLSIIGPGSSNFTIDSSSLIGGVFLVYETNNVTISGLKITGVPEGGVEVTNTDNSSFEDIVVIGDGVSPSGTLMQISGGSHNTFDDCHVSEGHLGFRIWSGATYNTITNSSSDNNRHSGLTIYGADNNTVTNNIITDTSVDFGMFVIFGSEDNLIEGNTITGHNLSGITMGGTEGDTDLVENNIIRNNTISNNGSGMSMTGFGVVNNTIQDNTISNNESNGIDIGSATPGENIGNIIIGNTINNNDDNGISTVGALDVTIGGTGEDEGNIITGNGSNGIYVSDAQDIVIQSNVISGNTLEGVTITGDSQNITIKGNFIGVLADGTTVSANGQNGIDIRGGTGYTIGGLMSVPTDRNIIVGNTQTGISSIQNASDITISGNVISGNEQGGMQMEFSDDIVIQGNYIGLDISGTEALLNNGSGLDLTDISNATIGGTTNILRNYFAGGERGITLEADTQPLDTPILIIGNYLGLNINGEVTGSGGNGGIQVNGEASGVTIGGTGPNEGNVVAGVVDGGFGIGVNLGGVGTRVFGNKIGTNPAGVPADGYGNDVGILAIGGGGGLISNQIGGINTGEGNIVAGNTVGGVLLVSFEGDSFSGMSVLGNSIFDNNGAEIDLSQLTEEFSFISQGPTANDAGDADVGPNQYLNTPVISAINTATGVISYSADLPAGTYRIEFFRNPTSGDYGEGEEFVGYDTLVSTGTNKTDTVTLSLEVGDVITATATEDLGEDTFGSTSEFSASAHTTSDVDDTPDPEPEPEPAPRRSSGGGTFFACRDLTATNYSGFGVSRPSLCIYAQTASIISNTQEIAQILGSGSCPANKIITHFMKKGDRDGRYGAYSKQVVTEVKLLQSHINRILAARYAQASGPEDGIFGVFTQQGVTRLQQALNDVLKPQKPLVIDGIVGPFTRDAINNSCGIQS